MFTSPGCSRALPLPRCVALDEALHLSELSFLIFKMGRTHSSQFIACWVDSMRINIMSLMQGLGYSQAVRKCWKLLLCNIPTPCPWVRACLTLSGIGKVRQLPVSPQGPACWLPPWSASLGPSPVPSRPWECPAPPSLTSPAPPTHTCREGPPSVSC